MKTVAIIPARLKSSRFNEKLLQTLNGKPIIINTYQNVSSVHGIDDCIIATDDKKIIDVAEKYNCKAVMTSINHESGTSRITEVAKNIECDVVINVQGDEPLINSYILTPIIKCFSDKSVDIATLKTKIEHNSPLIKDENTVKVVTDKNDFALYFSRSTIPHKRADVNIEAQYYKHIGVYAFRRDVLLQIESLPPCHYEDIEKLEQLRFLYNGLKIKVLTTDAFIHGVDTKEDLEYLMSYLSENK